MQKSNIVYIGICARKSGKRSGKDTVADAIQKHIEASYSNVAVAVKRSLADSLKMSAREIFGLSMQQMYGTEEQKESLTDWEWPENKYGNSGKMTARQILQFFGTEVMREGFDMEVWVKSVQRWAENKATENPDKILFVLVPDVRYPNESLFQDYIIDVYRPHAEDKNTDTHISERAGALIPDERIFAYIDNLHDMDTLEVKAKVVAELIYADVMLRRKEVLS